MITLVEFAAVLALKQKDLDAEIAEINEILNILYSDHNGNALVMEEECLLIDAIKKAIKNREII